MLTAAILTLAATTAGPVDLTPSPLYLAQRGRPGVRVILTPRLIAAPIGAAICTAGSCQRSTVRGPLPRLIPGQPIARFWSRRPIQRFWSRRPIANIGRAIFRRPDGSRRRPLANLGRAIFGRRR